MKAKLFFMFFLTSLLFACSAKPDYKLEKKQIVDLLDNNAKAYRTKDIKGIMNTYYNDSSTIALGTRRDFSGMGYSKIEDLYIKDFSQGWQMISYEYKNPVIRFHGDIAWLATDLYSEVKVRIRGTDYNLKLDSRLTAVCRRIKGEWKFVFTNFQHFKSPEQALNEAMKQKMKEEQTQSKSKDSK